MFKNYLELRTCNFEQQPMKLAAFILMVALNAAAAEKDGVLVVFNPRLEGSEEVAEYYAKKRGLRDNQILALPCTPNESVSRDEFRETIQKPLIEHLTESGWWKIQRTGEGDTDWKLAQSKLTHLVLCHGIPLKIAAVPQEQMKEQPPPNSRPELIANHAAVDSELVLLPQPKAPITGLIPNPMYNLSGLQGQKDWHLQMVLVARLDGPNPAAAKRLVDGALAGEQRGVWGRAVIDQRGLNEGAYSIGDKWLQDLGDVLKSSGWNPNIDRVETTMVDPGPFDQCAIYAGWYAGDICGPMAPREYRFQPGAIAYHIHSFSAASLRTFQNHWCGPLVARGAAATLGCTEEPYLQFSPHANIFFKHILFGKNFAESAYLSIPALSWQITVIGDPLYRPFIKSIDSSISQLKQSNDPNLAWALLRRANQLAAAGLADQAIAQLEAEAASAPSPLYFERLAELYWEKKDGAKSIELWKKALALAERPAQKEYYLFWVARSTAGYGDVAAALPHYKEFIRKYPANPMVATAAFEAKARATEKGMRTEAEYFERILTPPPKQ